MPSRWPTGSRPSSAPTPAPIRGRTGPSAGRTTCTSRTASRRPVRGDGGARQLQHARRGARASRGRRHFHPSCPRAARLCAQHLTADAARACDACRILLRITKLVTRRPHPHPSTPQGGAVPSPGGSRALLPSPSGRGTEGEGARCIDISRVMKLVKINNRIDNSLVL